MTSSLTVRKCRKCLGREQIEDSRIQTIRSGLICGTWWVLSVLSLFLLYENFLQKTPNFLRDQKDQNFVIK